MLIFCGNYGYLIGVIVLISCKLPVVLVQPVSANTSIVAIRVNNEVVVGADSKRIVERIVGDETRIIGTESACKIGKGDGFFFAAAGHAENPERGFSVASILREAEGASGTIRKKVGKLELLIKEQLTKVLERFRQEAPSAYERRFKMRSALTIAFFGLENDSPLLLMRDFTATALPNDPVQITIDRHDCPDDCGNGAVIALLGKHDAIDNFLNGQAPDYWKHNPADVVRKMIELEIDCHRSEVGPPIDIVRVDKTGAHWIQRKTECE